MNSLFGFFECDFYGVVDHQAKEAPSEPLGVVP
jgi:hypothetical protein